MNTQLLDFKTYCLSTGAPIDVLAMSVLAHAYRDAWRLVHDGEPAGRHTIKGLDLCIDFAGHASMRDPVTGLPPAPGPDRGRRVLYLDDDRDLLCLVRLLMERRGYRISTFSGHQAALAALRVEPDAFDLVLTDYNMPGISGLDVAREVRALRPDLPVAIACGRIDETLRAGGAAAGVLEVIPKGDVVVAYCDAIQRLVDGVGKRP